MPDPFVMPRETELPASRADREMLQYRKPQRHASRVAVAVVNPDGVALPQTTDALLADILGQLRVMNTYLSLIAGEELSLEDIA